MFEIKKLGDYGNVKFEFQHNQLTRIWLQGDIRPSQRIGSTCICKREDDATLFKGTSAIHPNDHPDDEIGRRVSLSAALAKSAIAAHHFWPHETEEGDDVVLESDIEKEERLAEGAKAYQERKRVWEAYFAKQDADRLRSAKALEKQRKKELTKVIRAERKKVQETQA